MSDLFLLIHYFILNGDCFSYVKKPTTAPKARARQRPELTEEQRQEIREAFDLFDTDGSGFIIITYLFRLICIYSKN